MDLLKASSRRNGLFGSLLSLIPPGFNVLQILIAVYALAVGTVITAGFRVVVRGSRVDL